MIKLHQKEQLENIVQYPNEVEQEVKKIIKLLNENYGDNRDVDKDLGGYILIIQTKEDINNIKENTLKGIVAEYTDVIKSDGGMEYYSSLFLLSNDYSVVVFSTKHLHEILIGRKL